EKVVLCGDFNDWSQSANQMTKKGDSWVTELRLKPASSFQFKYLCDAEWKNDDQADHYQENEFGTVNSVVVIEE
ncbi:isoamylase early set domain-containing protein, partial [Arthrospira platensis SPKY1]|nr:isoamylase early set domain-containing protein [Arthrospira platensis SPKY1]